MFASRISPALCAALLSLALVFTALCSRLALRARDWGPELAAVDKLFRLRGPLPVRGDFLLVKIDGSKRRLLDSRGRVARTTLAALIRRAKAGRARAIVVDVYLPDRTSHAADRDLWLAIARARNVFLPAAYLPDRSNVLSSDDVRNLHFLEESVLAGDIATYGAAPPLYVWWKFQPPVSDFTHSAAGPAGGVGVVVGEADPDGVVRRTRLAYLTDVVYPPGTPASRLILQGNVQNVVVPDLTIPLTTYLTQVDKSRVAVDYGRSIRYLGDLNPPVRIPIDGEGRMLINYAAPAGAFPAVNAADVLDGKVERGRFDAKVVFIGITGGPLADIRPTPFSPMPRVEITANAAATVLNRAFLAQSTADAWVPLGLLALFLALTFPCFAPISATVWALLTAVGYAFLALFCFRSGHYGILPLVPAFLLILLLWLAQLILRPAFYSRAAKV